MSLVKILNGVKNIILPILRYSTQESSIPVCVTVTVFPKYWETVKLRTGYRISRIQSFWFQFTLKKKLIKVITGDDFISR